MGTSIGVLKVRPVRSYTSIADQWKPIGRFEIAGVPWRPIPGRDGVKLKSHVRMASEFEDKMDHNEGQQQPFVVRVVKFFKGIHKEVWHVSRARGVYCSKQRHARGEPLRQL